MTRFSAALFLFAIFVQISTSAFCTQAAESASTATPAQVRISYEAPSDAKYRPIYDGLKRRQVLERLKGFLAPLRLPAPLTVTLAQCGTERKPYQSGGPVTVCYEMVQRIIEITSQRTKDESEQTRIIDGTFVEAVLHEVALAVFDLLQVPVWGRVEDAADRVAALIMIKFSDQVALTTILGTARFFEYSNQVWTGVDLADEGSPEAQRFYNYLCIAYGGDPRTFQFLAPRLGPSLTPRLSQHRVVRCEGEFRQVQHAFDLRIMPFVDPQLLVKVRAAQWLRTDEIPPGRE